LKRIGELYEVERQVARHDNEARLRIRQSKSLPQLGEIKKWLDKQTDNILPRARWGRRRVIR
jgi:hypothetical protein